MTDIKLSTYSKLKNLVLNSRNEFYNRVSTYLRYMEDTYDIKFDYNKIIHTLELISDGSMSAPDMISEEEAQNYLNMYEFVLPEFKPIPEFNGYGPKPEWLDFKFGESEGFCIQDSVETINKPDPEPEPDPDPIFTMNNNSITVVFEDETIIADSGNPKFEEMKQALVDSDFQLVKELYNSELNQRMKILNELQIGKISYNDGVIRVDGIESNNVLSDDIIEAFGSGDTDKAKKLMRFYDKVADSASNRVLENLYEFILNSDIDIDEEGMIIGWKKVDSNFMDIRTHSIDNHPGCHPTMPRNEVNDDPRHPCSTGLHVAAFGYLSHYSSCANDRIIKVMVDPRDVVCIPFDYNFKKMRTCGYIVLEEYIK